jgi:RNA polymerase sigma-70 factor (ECF subfamily)
MFEMSTLLYTDDEDLLISFQLGDDSAYEIIYDRYWALLYRHARKMLQNDEEAKDVVQEVFMMLWTRLSTQGVNQPLAAFLYAATRNKVLDQLKHSKVKARYAASLQQETERQLQTPDSLVRERQLAQQIESEIQFLPPKMREIFVLSRREYKSYKEISEQLQISDKTVKKQVSNALQILRVRLGTLLFLIFFIFICYFG